MRGKPVEPGGANHECVGEVMINAADGAAQRYVSRSIARVHLSVSVELLDNELLSLGDSCEVTGAEVVTREIERAGVLIGLSRL